MAEQDFDASRWLKQYQAEWTAMAPEQRRKRLNSALTYSGLLALGPLGMPAAQAYFAHTHAPQLRAVERALRQSVPRTMAFLRKQLSEFDPTELAALWPMLADTAMEAAAYIGGGGIVGAVLFGAPTGGLAAPVGAVLGMKAGTWVYNAVGIADMAADMPDMFDAVTKPYRKGFSAAWALGEMGAGGGADQHAMLETVAVESFAEGHTLLVVALLSALAVLLLRKGARNTPLFEALRRGKLGARFSDWARKNQLVLMESRRLKPRKSLGQRVAEADELERRRLSSGRAPDAPPTPAKEPKPPKLVPGTAEHKADRWKRYQARGGGKSYEQWSRQYDVNMRNYRHGAARETEYQAAMGGNSATLKTPFTHRQIDVFRGSDRYMGQIKTGPVSLTQENILAIKKDAWLVKRGFEVEHVLEGGASGPYLAALDAAGIKYRIGPQIPGGK